MNQIRTPQVEVYGLSVGLLDSNCYLIIDLSTRKAILVDPGGDPERIQEFCAMHNASVELIINTHGHGDHIGANGQIKAAFGVPIAIHRGDADCLPDPFLNLSAYFEPVSSPPADIIYEEEGPISWSGPEVKILWTPGHSPGSISILGDGWVICGDVLFRGSIGRTDFPRCDSSQLQKSIREKLLTLPPDTIVFPGHGPTTTISYEKSHNPFLLPE